MRREKPPPSVQDLVEAQRETLQNVNELRLQNQTLLLTVERVARWQEQCSEQLGTLVQHEQLVAQLLGSGIAPSAHVPAPTMAHSFWCGSGGNGGSNYNGKQEATKRKQAHDDLDLTFEEDKADEQCLHQREESIEYKSKSTTEHEGSSGEARPVGSRPDESQALGTMFGAGSIVSDYLKFCQQVAKDIVQWRKFDYFMGIIILANAICIGIEIEQELPCITGDPGGIIPGCDTSLMEDLNYGFLLIYIVELILRFVAGAHAAIKSGWVWFDMFLVFTGSLTSFVIIPITQGSGSKDPAMQTLSQLMVIRIARLGRLARALRLIQSCKNLWKLVQGVLKSFGTMGSVCIVLIIIIYIFACIAIEMIRKDEGMLNNPDMKAVIFERFENVPMTMMTLMQFYTMDSIAGFYYPMCVYKPALAVFFGSVFLVISISLMNMVTALIVQNAMESAAEDADMVAVENRNTLKRLAPLIKQSFRALDKTGDGSVTLTELEEAIEKKELHLPSELEKMIPQEKLIELFEILDSDGSGEIDEKEFTDGISHIVLSCVPIETTQMVRMLQNVVKDQKDQGEELWRIGKLLDDFFETYV